MDTQPPPAMRSPEVARTTTLIASTVLALAALLALAWLSATALLIIFAGIILAVALDAGARLLGRVMGLSHGWRLVIVVAALILLLSGVLAWGGTALVQQFDQLTAAIDEQVSSLADWFPRPPADRQDDGRGGISGLLPDMRTMFGGATNAIFSLFGAIGNLVVILFLGAFFAADPGLYKAGMLSLIPRDRRERLSGVLDESAGAIRGWLVGQAISMATIFLVSWALLWLAGMPYAFLLALQAGLLAFIPTLGPAVAGVVIVLGGLAVSPQMALLGVGVYLLIQGLESNILQPVVQKKTVHLAPAFTLGFQLVMGALFGILGIALAVPLAAAGKVIIDELYVKDALGGPSHFAADPEPE